MLECRCSLANIRFLGEVLWKHGVGRPLSTIPVATVNVKYGAEITVNIYVRIRIVTSIYHFQSYIKRPSRILRNR